MDARALLSAYDEQVRRSPQPVGAGETVEREQHLTRVVNLQGGWTGVSWSDLQGVDLDEVIRAQIDRFRDCPGGWEWKHYSHDRPAELPERLIAAGLQAGEAETLMGAAIAALDLGAGPPEGVTLRDIGDLQGARALARMQDEVFQRPIPGMAERMMAGIAVNPPTTAAVAAIAGGQTVAGGRVEFDPGSDFAGLWGGATAPAFRGRGIFRALVARRAALAAQRGYRYLQVDASAQSRPILARLGFIELATTTPYMYPRGS